MTRRGGGAIALTMVLLLVVFPIVAAMFTRSQAAIGTVTKLNSQVSATALAEEGEAAALDTLRAGGATGTGDRPTPEGGMHWWIFPYLPPTGAGGQSQFLVAGEGIYLGEERLVVSVAETSLTSGAPLVITRDRAWIPSGEGGGTRTDAATLIADEQQKIDRYLNLLSQESTLTTDTFLNRMSTQVSSITAEIGAAWPTLSPEFARAKAPQVP